MFGYIVDWARRAAQKGGRLIEVNPDETLLSPWASELIRQPAGTALPSIVEDILSAS